MMSKITTEKLCDGTFTCYDQDQYDGAPDAGPQDIGYGKTEEEARQAFFEGKAQRESVRDCTDAQRRLDFVTGNLSKYFT
jgi:hypothetical protein